MNKNIKILFCILGSIFLILLQIPLFRESGQSFLFGGPYGGNLYGEIISVLNALLSFIGYLLFITFSIILIINNNPFKK